MRANQILLGSASSRVNMWKVRLDSRCFLVTPAHVAVFAKEVDPEWTISPYLQEFKNLDWKIPAKYLALQSGAYDIAYAECDESVDALALDIHEVKAPEKGTVFCRQPLDENVEMRVDDPAFRAEEVMLYKASGGSRLLEAFNVGFRGQSGAGIFAEISTDLLGICVRRGILPKAKHTVVEDVPPTVSPLGKLLQSLLGLDRIAADVAEIKSKMVHRDDLWEVSASFNFRRGLFLPASSFEPLMVHEPSVHIKEMEGKKAEVIHF